MPAMHNSMYLL